MTTTRETALRFYDLINRHDLDGLRAIAADDYVGHGFGDAGGPDALRDDLAGMLHAFPDLRVDVEVSLVDGDQVAIRNTMSGTHSSDFAGFPASGNRIEVPSCDVMRVADGKVAEFWPLCDTARLFHQLGAAMATG